MAERGKSIFYYSIGAMFLNRLISAVNVSYKIRRDFNAKVIVTNEDDIIKNKFIVTYNF